MMRAESKGADSEWASNAQTSVHKQPYLLHRSRIYPCSALCSVLTFTYQDGWH